MVKNTPASAGQWAVILSARVRFGTLRFRWGNWVMVGEQRTSAGKGTPPEMAVAHELRLGLPAPRKLPVPRSLAPKTVVLVTGLFSRGKILPWN